MAMTIKGKKGLVSIKGYQTEYQNGKKYFRFYSHKKPVIWRKNDIKFMWVEKESQVVAYIDSAGHCSSDFLFIDNINYSQLTKLAKRLAYDNSLEDIQQLAINTIPGVVTDILPEHMLLNDYGVLPEDLFALWIA